MEDQQTEMIRLREAAAHEKDAATSVQTRLLKQVGALRKSQSSPTAEGKCADSHVTTAYHGIRAFHQKLEA